MYEYSYVGRVILGRNLKDVNYLFAQGARLVFYVQTIDVAAVT